MAPRTRAASALLLLIPLGGCCSISLGLQAVFCGPRQPLPRREYLTPQQGLGTLVAAIASDDLDTLFETLGPELKERWELGLLETGVMWDILKKKVPGIHLLDQAERGPATLRDGLTWFRLSLAGQVIDVAFKQYTYSEFVTLLEGETEPEAVSEFLETKKKLGEILRVKTEADRGTVTVRIRGMDFTPLPDELLRVRVEREWLVYDLKVGR